MSAPNPGRQSPDEERQPGAQQQEATGSGKAEPNAAPSDEYSKTKSDENKESLGSNPVHPLDKHAKEKAT
ncbi:uncharacterized protein BHQ10_004493 [Talaromyces amestolkiae]|uniref:Uncharacterized protein n=1 Tax=Talaromyces amestolkiae TaxID=1196081 RepID=A0A364KYB7_TALAM|nr:uncharacterized protein BHQ10_004493 [Talaromyces amestolkiae]RAO68481.1 hypothetical protein BHQ10_004493 [Talaromyces amestolkiae]